MTHSQLFDLAIDAGFPLFGENYDRLPRLIEIALQAERESIAQDCQRMLDNRLEHLIPDRIRMRGEP
jgi:hypothetical protein